MQKLPFYLILTTASLLIGCTSTPQPSPDRIGYCTTDSDYSLKNGNVANSEVNLQCSDNPLSRAEKFYGVDTKTCRPWVKKININGTIKTTSGYLCKDENNDWRPLTQY